MQQVRLSEARASRPAGLELVSRYARTECQRLSEKGINNEIRPTKMVNPEEIIHCLAPYRLIWYQFSVDSKALEILMP